MKLKSLIKISLSSCHKKVSPLASSILYHLFGKSVRVDGPWGKWVCPRPSPLEELLLVHFVRFEHFQTDVSVQFLR